MKMWKLMNIYEQTYSLRIKLDGGRGNFSNLPNFYTQKYKVSHQNQIVSWLSVLYWSKHLFTNFVNNSKHNHKRSSTWYYQVCFQKNVCIPSKIFIMNKRNIYVPLLRIYFKPNGFVNIFSRITFLAVNTFRIRYLPCAGKY